MISVSQRLRWGMLLCCLVVPAQAQLLVSSDFGHSYYAYDPVSGIQVGVAPLVSAASGGLDQPHAAWVQNGDLLIASFGTHDVKRFDRISGAFQGNFITNGAGLNAPVYMDIGPVDNLLYVSSQGNDQMLRFDRYSGAPADVAPFISGGLLDGPSGFDWSRDRARLYVAGRYSANVLAYDPLTGAPVTNLHTLASGLGVGSTFGLKVDPLSGDIFVASGGDVARYTTSGTFVTTITIPGLAIGIETSPYSSNLYVAANNNLYFINPADNSVTGPLLTGDVINVLNFFHFVKPEEMFVGPITNALAENSGQHYLAGRFHLARRVQGFSATVQTSTDLLEWSNAASYLLSGTNYIRDGGTQSVQMAFETFDHHIAITERVATPGTAASNLFMRVLAD